MCKKRILLLCLAFILVVSFTSCKKSYPKEMLAWLKTAKLGPYEEHPQNWSEIENLAKKEGEIVVYSSSSRMSKVAQLFEKEYPEIKVIMVDLGSVKTVERTIKEQNSGLFVVDVLRTGGSAQVLYNLLAKNKVVNFIPDQFVDKLLEKHKTPLLIGLEEALVFMYNGDKYPDNPPIKNIWELTMPEWKGKVIFKNPMDSLSIFIGISTIIQHKKEMEQAYKDLTGEKLVLSSGIEHAGYEFFHRLVENDVILFKSGTKVAKATGDHNLENAPIGFNNYSYMRHNRTKNYVNKVLFDLKPFSVIEYPTYFMIARQAPHPNAAKLFISFLMGSKDITLDTKIKEPYEEGKSAKLLKGLAPYYRIGEKSTRLDVPLPEGSRPWGNFIKKEVDPEYMWKEFPKIKEFWLTEYAK